MAWAVAAALILVLVAVPVWAGEPTTMEVEAGPDVALGDRVTVRVGVTDGQGGPVAGAIVVLLSPASFGATSGEMRLGQVTTDDLGWASFTYEARREGQQTLIARFPGNEGYAPAEASLDISVYGSTQLYQQEAGVRVPGIGVWLLVFLLSAFWCVYLVVMGHITLIAREGGKAPLASGGGRG
jgi:hypothetical protein